MSNLIQIKTIRNQTLERMMELTASPKPSYSIDGQAVSWNDYLRQLQDTVKWCDEMIQREEPDSILTLART